MLGRAQAVLEALGCHAIILYGSRARGDADDDSDWDIAGVRAGGETMHIVDGLLDLFAYPESHFATLSPDDLKLAGGTIVSDRDGFGLALLERLAAYEAAGPLPLAAWKVGEIRNWYPKMLRRIARGDDEAGYRRAMLVHDALPDWFVLRGLWFRGAKHGLAWLRDNQPTVHACFARAMAPAARQADYEALVDAVLAVPDRAE